MRSDFYSVGVILFEFLTGHRPFTGPITRLVFDHLYTAPPSFAEKNPSAEVPAAVERLVLRCLAKDPAARPQTARELFEDFRAALSSGTTVPGPSAPFADAPPLPPTELLSTVAQGSGPRTEAYRLPGEAAAPPPTSYPEVTEEVTRPADVSATQPIVREPFAPPSWGVPPSPAVAPPAQPVGTLAHSTFTEPAAKPGPKPSRRLFLTGLIALPAVAGLAAAYYFLIRKPSVRPPEGYRAEGPIDPGTGLPSLPRPQVRRHAVHPHPGRRVRDGQRLRPPPNRTPTRTLPPTP